jgi:hypothetical protein
LAKLFKIQERYQEPDQNLSGKRKEAQIEQPIIDETLLPDQQGGPQLIPPAHKQQITVPFIQTIPTSDQLISKLSWRLSLALCR